MKLQNLTVIFIIIILPIILITSLYITTGLKTIELQARYDTGLIDATFDAISAFEKNTANITLSGNPEIKRSIINASIKMFEKSLCNTCNISSYNANEIEQYIPAMVFGMYDGFYMYAPSGEKNEYKHNLKNYVYYSETLKGIGQGDTDIVIMYSLDNYVTVCGDFVEVPGEIDEGYITKSGYLTVCEDGYGIGGNGTQYKKVKINNADAKKYYWESYVFTDWFNTHIDDKLTYLHINNGNDPENKNSQFVQHKRAVIKNKIEGVLNSTITAYSNKTFGRTYKMPKLTLTDWEKIYSNISMVTFLQGKKIGFTQYNGYCVLNSTNNNEYVNPNLMYFIDGEDKNTNYYHDIRCTQCKDATTLTGYKTGAFRIRKSDETNDDGTAKYVYDHQALACYECINAPFSTNKSVYEYIWGIGNTTKEEKIKSAYWTSLGRERYNSKRVNASKIRVISKDGIRVGYYNDISTALIECKDGDTVEILEEIKLTKRLGIGQYGDLNINITGKITTTEDIYIFAGSTVNMNNVTIIKESGEAIDGENGKNVINNNGTLTINSSTITNTEEGEVVILNRSITKEDIDNKRVSTEIPTLIINNSTISNNTATVVIGNDRANLTINYSSITNVTESGGIGTTNVIGTNGGDVKAFNENEEITFYVESNVTINGNPDISGEMIQNNGSSNIVINGNRVD